MAGHSHWAGIKHKKEITDQKRAKVFSKLCAAITAAARTEPNPDFNPRLRTAIETARAEKIPADKIARAIEKAVSGGEGIEELIFEAYGPGGIAIFIEAISDNKNRTVQEIKKLLGDYGGKWAETGAVAWAFEKSGDTWNAKFPQKISPDDAQKLADLLEALGDQDQVQKVYTNAEIL